MGSQHIPHSIVGLFWDVDPASIDLDRDRAFVFERVMTRGTWEAMQWLRRRYPKDAIAEFLRSRRARNLAPRDLAYWALIADVEVEVTAGGGRPRWAGT